LPGAFAGAVILDIFLFLWGTDSGGLVYWGGLAADVLRAKVYYYLGYPGLVILLLTLLGGFLILFLQVLVLNALQKFFRRLVELLGRLGATLRRLFSALAAALARFVRFLGRLFPRRSQEQEPTLTEPPEIPLPLSKEEAESAFPGGDAVPDETFPPGNEAPDQTGEKPEPGQRWEAESTDSRDNSTAGITPGGLSIGQEVIEEEVPYVAQRRAYFKKYNLPAVDLLDSVDESRVYHISREEMENAARLLEAKLRSFGVEAAVRHVAPGPVITRYELELAPGVKVNQVSNLSDDLALALKADSIRILPQIRGKSLIGIEVPNPRRNIVYLRNVINSEPFAASRSPLLVALGKTTSGEAFIADLQKMPHLLIAGQTGAGKSVCINAILASILFRVRPTDVQLVLIDPKMIELSDYRRIKEHFLCTLPGLGEDVVTRPENAVHILNAVTAEMERRYRYLSHTGYRNIGEFNEAVDSGVLKEMEDGSPPRRMVYLVVVVDELADLMISVGKDIEVPIARLAQKARAVGIHLIVATQRPSVDVITGVIKANFPARIAFAVRQKVDSRTILDMPGAEKLLGNGDMLYLGPDTAAPIRIHGSYISGKEIQNILRHIHRQPQDFEKFVLQDISLKNNEENTAAGDTDPLFETAREIVIRTQQGSVSVLQRKLKIGYNRAARIIDQLEAAGVVGPADGSKGREVLLTSEFLDGE